ncbi:hypothetical protein AeMF1_017435 [Aphanomyces euteiches]|nr:hypothetical protein AeMF1_017435 [Aphanomyces euteiches]
MNETNDVATSGYTGATKCVAGATCTKQNDYYSQCVPGSAPSPPSPSSAAPKPSPSMQPSSAPKPPPPSSSPPSPRSGGQPKPLPSSFKCTSTGPIISAKNDGKGVVAIKDPSIIQVGDTYHATPAKPNKLLSTTSTKLPLAGDTAAPEVFYFAPQKLWYLVYQNGNAAYSTNKDISNPAGWSAPKNFYNGMPAIIKNNIGNGNWVDMFVICDSANCHLFSSDDNGHLYRSQTSLANFPNGMSQPVIALQDANKNNLFEASAVYKTGNQYLLIVEAAGSNGRYFRSWTASSLSGSWTPLAASEANPFARSNNVAFPGGAWTTSISHGELIRTQTDQTLTVDLCKPLRFLYQGLNPKATGPYDSLPWQLGLLTQTNSAGC